MAPKRHRPHSQADLLRAWSHRRASGAAGPFPSFFRYRLKLQPPGYLVSTLLALHWCCVYPVRDQPPAAHAYCRALGTLREG